MLEVAIPLVLVVVGLLVVATVKVQATAATLRWLVGSMDQRTRRLGVVAVLPGAGIAIWLVVRDIRPPAALVVGVLAAFGVYCLELALFKMDGVLLETESAFLHRVSTARPPPSSVLGRLVTALVGLAVLAGTFAALSVTA